MECLGFNKRKMSIEKNLELLNLRAILNDALVVKKLGPLTMEDIIERYIDLTDEFVKQYELPENSAKSSLTN
jgi:hypothetical protein